MGRARKAHGDAAGTRALVQVLLLHRHMDGEHVVAGLPPRCGPGRSPPMRSRWRPARPPTTPTARQPGTPPAGPPAVASLTARRLGKLPPDTRPLPSVAAYDQLLRRNRTAQEGPRP